MSLIIDAQSDVDGTGAGHHALSFSPQNIWKEHLDDQDLEVTARVGHPDP